MTSDEVRARILAGIPGATVTVTDTTGTGDHFSATVVATEFEGKSMMAQHRLIYAALGELMRGPIHALQLDTRAP
jgi:stress-induced morphogen